MTRKQAASRKSPLAELVDASPFTSRHFAEQLGLSLEGWWQMRIGGWRLNEERQEALAMLLGVPLRRVRDAANETVLRRKTYLAKKGKP